MASAVENQDCYVIRRSRRGKRSGKIPLSRCAIFQSYELDPFTCDWKQNNLERRVRRRGRWFSSTANDETTILTDDDVKRKPQCGDSFLLDWTIEFLGRKEASSSVLLLFCLLGLTPESLKMLRVQYRLFDPENRLDSCSEHHGFGTELSPPKTCQILGPTFLSEKRKKPIGLWYRPLSSPLSPEN